MIKVLILSTEHYTEELVQALSGHQVEVLDPKIVSDHSILTPGAYHVEYGVRLLEEVHTEGGRRLCEEWSVRAESLREFCPECLSTNLVPLPSGPYPIADRAKCLTCDTISWCVERDGTKSERKKA